MLRSSSIPTNPATFSPRTQRGRASLIIRSMSGQRSRSSPLPFCFPATLNGWHGNPPVTMSTGACPTHESVLMSSYIFACGQCCLSIFLQYGLISQNVCSTFSHTQSAASELPPMPENKSRCRHIIKGLSVAVRAAQAGAASGDMSKIPRCACCSCPYCASAAGIRVLCIVVVRSYSYHPVVHACRDRGCRFRLYMSHLQRFR